MPPVPASGRTSAFCQGGGEFLKIVEEACQGQRGVGDGVSNRKEAAGRLSRGPRHPKKESHQLCRMSSETGKCQWRDCVFVHDAPPRDSSPSPLSAMGAAAVRRRRGLGRVPWHRPLASRLGPWVAGGARGVAALVRDKDTGQNLGDRPQRQSPVGRPWRRLRAEEPWSCSLSVEWQRGYGGVRWML